MFIDVTHAQRFAHLANKTEAFAGHRRDQTRCLVLVANYRPSGVQARCHLRIRDDACLPDGIDEVVLADYALAVEDQVLEKIKYLRCYGEGLHPPDRVPACPYQAHS